LAILTAEAAKLVALLTGQTVGAAAAIAIGLLDPAMDGRRARLELPGQILNAPAGTRQGDDLLPELRSVTVPRSRHDDTLLS
jgi:hypothetical protein